MKKILLLAVTFGISFAVHSQNLNYPHKPKLILVLVYDQFRSDYLTRYTDQFLPANKAGKLGGFRYLQEQGAYMPFAKYEVLQSMTCPGHAMILTGSYPYANGIAINDWFDPITKKPTYCADDHQFQLSPRNLKGSTLGDELKLAYPASKTVALSLKDRSAIMLGGRSADLALWLNSKKMTWETSEYYKLKKPNLEWVEKINSRIQALSDTEMIFKPSLTKANFSHKAKANSSIGLGFPYSGELLSELSKTALEQYKLGQSKGTDILAVSFSTHDMSGHHFGPNSDEMFEMTLQEDRQLADLLNFVNKKVGMKNVWIMLTADHGVAPMVEKAKEIGLEAGRLEQQDLFAMLNSKLSDRFGKLKEDSYVLSYKSLNFYLNREQIQKKGLKLSDVEAYAKLYLLEQDGVEHVFTRSEYINGKFPPGMFESQLKKSYILDISGDVIFIPKPFWYESSDNAPTNHMTGYSYDASVPLILVGAPFKKGVYGIPAKVVDAAPTLSHLLGILPPALSEGRVLTEVLK